MNILITLRNISLRYIKPQPRTDRNKKKININDKCFFFHIPKNILLCIE